LKTTQMVNDQYKSAGALKPYQTTLQSNGAGGGVSVPSTTMQRSASMPPGGNSSGMANKKLPPGSGNAQASPTQTSGAALANQLPTNFPRGAATSQNTGNSATSVGNNGAKINPYDKVPNLRSENQYTAPPVSGANGNVYQTLQKIPASANEQPGSTSGNTTAPNGPVFRAPYSTSPAGPLVGGTGKANAAAPAGDVFRAPYSTSPAGTPVGGTGKANAAAPAGDVFRAPYSTSPAGPPVGGTGKANAAAPAGDVFRAPYSTVPANNTYDKVPPLNPNQQAATSTANAYSPPPVTGPNNGKKRTHAYGPAPAQNPPGTNNNYGAPPVTGLNNQNRQYGTYGPAPAQNTSGTNNNYAAPPVTGSSNQNRQYGTYGPAPALNTPGTNNNFGAPPVIGSQRSGNVPPATQPNLKTGANPKVPANNPNGGAKNVPPKKSPPKRGK
jgi:hypothetical protein